MPEIMPDIMPEITPESMLKTQGLEKRFGAHLVLKGLNLTVHRGEIYGFIGHNGAGKSTTMQILMGLLSADGGTVNRGFSTRQQVGYLPESPEFFPYMTAAQYLHYIGTAGGHSPQSIKRRTAELLEQVSLTAHAKRPIGGFSRGMKQRLGLAVALYHDPELLLLDEPSSALDPLGRQDVVRILEALKAQGKTIFLSTHILDDIEKICDRIGVLHGGIIAIEGPLQQLLQSAGGQAVSVRFTDEVSPEAIETFTKQVQTQYKLGIEVLEDRRILFRATEAKPQLQEQGLSQDDILSQLLKHAANTPRLIHSVSRHGLALEDLYMKVVKA